MASCTHSRSCTWSPGAPFLRVHCPELPMTAVIFHQFLPSISAWAFNLYIACCSDCTTRTFHMSKPAKLSFSQNKIKVLKLKLCQQLAWSYWCHILWPNAKDLFHHGPVILLQALQVPLCQWPSFTGMEHGTLHARAVDMTTSLVREVAGCENW